MAYLASQAMPPANAARGRWLGRAAAYVAFQIYFALLYWSYATYLTELYGYEGYDLVPSSARHLTAVAAMALLPSLLWHRSPLIELFLHVVLAMVVAPALVLYAASDFAPQFALITVVAFAVLRLFSQLELGRLPDGFLNQSLLLKAALFLCAAYLAVTLLFGGARTMNFDISRVYEFRSEASYNLPGVFSYITPLIAKVVLPFGLTVAVLQRKYKLVAFFTVFAILLFGFTAHKSLLIFPLVILFVYGIAQLRLANVLFIGLLTVLVAASAYDMHSFLSYGNERDAPWFGLMVLRRSLFVPSLLNFYYFDFFADSGNYLYWAESKISLGLVNSPLEMRAVNEVALEYFNKPGMNANTGFVGSGFANAGNAGVMIYAAVLGFILAFLNAAERKFTAPFTLALASIPVGVALLSSDLLTTLGTHGLAPTLLLFVVLMPPQNHNAMQTDT